MSIIRVKKDARYFTASNEPFQDKRLSWEARGLMGYLLTKPNNWTVRIDDLIQQGPAKLTKIRRMLAEARLYGYMNRIRYTRPDGTFDWITEVYESPSQNPAPSSSVRLSTSGLPTSGKPADIASTELTSTELIKERDTKFDKTITTKLSELQGGGLKSTDADLLNTWAEKHTNEWILKAIQTASDKGAKSSAYVDRILIGWEANGYPKTREQLITESRVTRRTVKAQVPTRAPMERLVREL